MVKNHRSLETANKYSYIILVKVKTSFYLTLFLRDDIFSAYCYWAIAVLFMNQYEKGGGVLYIEKLCRTLHGL
jgi:hypothetical protein